MNGVMLLAPATGMPILGADLFPDNLAAVGRRFGVSVLLLLAGAEPEDLRTASLAAARGHGGLAAGDALGTNVIMLTAVLGLVALVRPVPVGALLVICSVLLAALIWRC